jgi:hypothetical protein
VIVTLSDDGHLQCSYLGTDPSLFQAPIIESRELNYDELDVELKELQKVIKDFKSQGISFATFYLILVLHYKIHVFLSFDIVLYILVNFLPHTLLKTL